MRGNHGRNQYDGCQTRSIPAHAGEPGWPTCCRPRPRVYPRTCGGTIGGKPTTSLASGLSPHMRGNLVDDVVGRVIRRSIPAHAGEPSRRHTRGNRRWVYPRTCGGTIACKACRRQAPGLSPHMRGNPARRDCSSSLPGSIPAHAGEPLSPMTAIRSSWVYPRTCGGTDRVESGLWFCRGLSPHMRGNRGRWRGHGCGTGSIPAHAGEPRPGRSTALPHRVYPRTCGGTVRRGYAHESRRGLSPHMRGNRVHGALLLAALGSIPAHAGEPGNRGPIAPDHRVYPRTCGGTS